MLTKKVFESLDLWVLCYLRYCVGYSEKDIVKHLELFKRVQNVGYPDLIDILDSAYSVSKNVHDPKVVFLESLCGMAGIEDDLSVFNSSDFGDDDDCLDSIEQKFSDLSFEDWRNLSLGRNPKYTRPFQYN